MDEADRARHGEAARIRAQMLASAASRESAQAQKLVDAFTEEARKVGLPTVALKARTLSGGTVRTNVRGWYIRNDHSVAVGEDGKYYQLIVAGGFMSRVRGAELEPSPPPLVVGRGGKEGETGDLKDFLNRALAGQVRA